MMTHRDQNRSKRFDFSSSLYGSDDVTELIIFIIKSLLELVFDCASFYFNFSVFLSFNSFCWFCFLVIVSCRVYKTVNVYMSS